MGRRGLCGARSGVFCLSYFVSWADTQVCSFRGLCVKPFELLWRSRKFWLAVVAVIQTVVLALIPDFPDEVWAAINVILLWLIGMIAAEDVAGKVGGR